MREELTIDIKGVTKVTGQLPHPNIGVGAATEAHLTVETHNDRQY